MPGLPPSLQQIAGRAMAVDPRDRFESAEAMLEALRPPPNPAEVPTRVIVPPPVVPSSSTTHATASPTSSPTAVAPPERTEALTHEPRSAPRRRRKLWVALALTTGAACALIVCLFVLLEGGAQTTGRGVPGPRTHTASTIVSPTTFATTTTTFMTTTTFPKHHGGSVLHQLHKEAHDGLLPTARGHQPGSSGGRKGQG